MKLSEYIELKKKHVEELELELEPEDGKPVWMIDFHKIERLNGQIDTLNDVIESLEKIKEL